MSAPLRVAFLGVGTMGYPMAGHLARGGYAVSVYNRTGAAAEKWCREHGGRHAATPANAAADADMVIACVSDDAAVHAVTVGAEGAFGRMKPGTVYVDHTTSSASVAQELSALAQQRGLAYLDAPVTGGKPGATKGTLTTMVGGDAEVLEKCREVIGKYAKTIAYVGPSGAGQIAKMANQMCIAGILQSLAEALGLVEKSGLDAARVLEVLVTGSGRSWQMENRGSSMVAGKYDFGFSVELLAKDLGICLAEASRRHADMPATVVAQHSYRTLMQKGFNQEDVAAVMRLFR